jgi:probable phosphoglycerate mutase
MKKTIYLIRHGQTDYNLKGIVQGGGIDSDLNATGRQQAKAFFECYRHLEFESVLTSRLKRTHQTVEHFVDAGLPWEQFEEINEMNWGEHEGKSANEEMHQEWKRVVGAWAEGNYHVRISGGESAWDMGQRLLKSLDHLQERPEQTLLICSHGRAMRGMVCLMRELELRDMGQFRHANTGLYLAEWDTERYHFHLENDLQHLARLESKAR